MFFAEQREQNAKTTYSDAITFLYYNSFQDRKTIEDKKVTKIIDIHFSQGRKMDSIILKIIVLKDRTIIFRLRFWHAVRKNTTKNPPEKLFTNEKQLLDFEKGGVMRLSQGSECEELMFIFGALARKEFVMIRVINKYREQVGDGLVINIMRGNILGNPFPITKAHSREQVIEKYKHWLWGEILKKSDVYKALVRICKVSEDKDVYLGCCCKPKACHGDVVLSAINWMKSK